MKDYLSILADIPAKHGGLLFEQLNRAALVAATIMRAQGAALPGDTRVPTIASVRAHLEQMVNRALDGYFATKEKAPGSAKANEIWGEDGDRLFSVLVTGVSVSEEDGFTAEIDMNLLYVTEN